MDRQLPLGVDFIDLDVNGLRRKRSRVVGRRLHRAWIGGQEAVVSFQQLSVLTVGWL